jgi:hypothetical protein
MLFCPSDPGDWDGPQKNIASQANGKENCRLLLRGERIIDGNDKAIGMNCIKNRS